MPKPRTQFGQGGIGVLLEDLAYERERRVIWRWNDPIPHSTTSDTGVWDSGVKTGEGKEFRRKFNEAGTFPYKCIVHPNMVGTVNVTP